MTSYNKLREIKMDIRYRNGKIYILKHKDSDKQYIGSTIKTLNARLSEHKSAYKKYLKGGYNQSSFKLFDLGIEGVYIELLEKYPCGNIIYLESRETYHIKNNDCINTNIPYRTPKEWTKKNKNYNVEKYIKYKNIKMSCRICRKEYSKATFTKHLREVHKIN